jgi:hypothetical protein
MEELVPLLVAVTVLAMVFSLTMFISQVQPVKVLVAAAARNCARAGVETLSAGRGLYQAQVTAADTALASTAIDPEGLAVRVYAEDSWGRGRVFVCETGYRIPVGHLPLVGWFYGKDEVTLQSRVALSIEPYKSRWERQ